MGKIIIIAGPTASGKSQAALKLAEEIPSVIINADSMQVYREIPILSAQPGNAEKNAVPHKLYGFISTREEFSAGRWLDTAKHEIDLALKEEITPIIVGGTGMYLKSLVKGLAAIPDISAEIKDSIRKMFEETGKEKFYEYLKKIDASAAEKIRPSDKQRMLRTAEVFLSTGKSILYWQENTKPHYPKEYFTISLMMPDRTELYRRCDSRFSQMLENGALKEVKKLQKMELPQNSPALKALGVKELADYLDGKISRDEAIKNAQQSTRNYAKRQYTWFGNQML